MNVIQRGIRAIVPHLTLPLCLLAAVLTAAPWMRSFPVSVAGAPLYGAALLSVLAPTVVIRIRPGWLWLSVLVDAALFVAFGLLVVLQDPSGFGDLVHGLLRGPSEILTFALPLVSPRSLMIAPAALVWLAGTLAGECIARRWHSLLPYVGFLVAFGLAYAGTQRAVGADLSAARSRETLLAAALLLTLLLVRVAQSWVRQDETAQSTQADGVLPLRGLVVGTAMALVIAVAASLAVQTGAFPKRADAPQRVPTVDQSRPLTPLAFIAGLRPRTAKEPGEALFSVTIDLPTSGYLPIANVDFYDGTGWSFQRTFRPSGGVLPDDTDAALRSGSVVTQHYTILRSALTAEPWMPFLYRAQRVTGISVNIDPASGMIVPANALTAPVSYTVQSQVRSMTFDQVKANSTSPDTATPTIDTQLPGSLRVTLDRLVHAFAIETGTPTSPTIPFLQALQRDLRANYTLSGAAQGSSSGAATSTAPTPSSTPKSGPGAGTSPGTTPGTTPRTTPKKAPSTRHRPRALDVRPLAAKPTPRTTRKTTPRTKPRSTPPVRPAPGVASSGSPAGDLAGGTSFADVLASILGQNRFGTPEQFATLMALVARDLGVPARVATGFRVAAPDGGARLPAGRYDVTTADAWSWVEVPLNGVGWVVLDGSPSRFTKDNQPTESGAPPPPSSTAPPSQNALVTQGNNGHAVAPKSRVPQTISHVNHALLIALFVALGVLLVSLLVVLLARKRVRAARRRRSPDPRTRLIGAWQENLDVLTEAGLPELATLTSSEIADLTGEQFGTETGAETASLGVAANAVAYSRATVVAAQDADAAWTRQRTISRAVHRQLGVRGRFVSGLRYHRPKRAAHPVSPESWLAARTEVEPRHGTTRRRPRDRGRRRAH
ncbi:MAG: transglutaminase domain-containing protein [Jatrophihabitantaceae bacterium]